MGCPQWLCLAFVMCEMSHQNGNAQHPLVRTTPGHKLFWILLVFQQLAHINAWASMGGLIVIWTIGSTNNITWLILPVVICLSQRLSHACLSISVSLRNCEWLIKTVIVSMSVFCYLDIHGNSRANTCVQTRLCGRVVLIRHWTIPGLPGFEVIDGNRTNRMLCGDDSFKFLTYQLPTVGYWPTVALTGNGELGFDSGEGAWETATTSKEGSRRANYPILTQGGSDKK